MGGTHDNPSAHEPQHSAQVILLRSSDAEVPAALHAALDRNNSTPIEVDHALAAFSHLCITRQAVLLLCEPERLVAVSELLAAVERFVPRTVCWEYAPNQSPPLRPIESQSSHAATAKSSVAPHQPPQPTLRSDSFALRLSTEAQSAAGPVIPGEILSRDEMEALFSEDPR